MRMKRRDRNRRDGSFLAAMVVAVAAVAAGLLANQFVSVQYRAMSTIAASAAVAAITVVATTRTLVIRRLLGTLRKSNRQLARTTSLLEDERAARTALREFVRALDTAEDERSVLSVAENTFRRHLAPHSTELHLVDRVDPILALAFATGDHVPLPDSRPSPWVSLAGRASATLVYESTTDPEVCAHLAERLAEPASAVAVPLIVANGLLGVLYAFGPDGKRPGVQDVAYVEDFAIALAARLAVIRSVSDSPPDDRVDRLTGLPDRTTTQRRLLSMIDDRRSFTIAVADIDNFNRINEVAGRDEGDRALEILAATARKAVRPIDIVGRIGGDELLFIFPDTTPDDAVKALERLREALFLTQATAEAANFTLSIGVIGSSYGGPIDKILMRAADALRYAKSEGGNRVVLAPPVGAAPPV